jgi:hypothetical protein
MYFNDEPFNLTLIHGMVPSTWPPYALRKFASFLAKLLKSSLRQGRFVLRIFCFLLRRLGSIVHFDHGTHSTKKHREEICTSSSPVIRLPATDDDQPGEQRCRTLAVPVDTSSPQHQMYLMSALRRSSGYSLSAVNTSVGHQALSAGSGGPLSLPEPSIPIPEPHPGELTPNIPVQEPQPGQLIPATPVQEPQPGQLIPATPVQEPYPSELITIIPTDVKRYERHVRM